MNIQITLDKNQIENLIRALPYWDMVNFIVDNNLNSNKQYVYLFIQILKENFDEDLTSPYADKRFSSDKFLEDIQFWEN